MAMSEVRGPAARRRVAVTGLGIVSPHGDDPAVVFDALCAGRSAIRMDAASGVPVASVAFDPKRWFTAIELVALDRVSQFAVVAADGARADAGWAADHAPFDRERVGVYVGTGFGGTGAVTEAYRRFHAADRIPP